MLEKIKFLLRNYSTYLHSFVPKYSPVLSADLLLLEEFLSRHNKILIVTGAGISTESGIPDYRSEGVGLYARTNRKPILYQTFVKSTFARQRYWARNFVGWPKFSSSLPNSVHFSVRDLELHNKVSAVITQNVDNLHTAAGSQNIVELHGSAYWVICTGCSDLINRHEFQNILTKLNPGMTETASMIRPDGDVEISEEKIGSFRIPLCEKCGEFFKPDIVFFGDNVPMSRVNLVKDYVENSDSVLVLGSSLTVFSSYRIILQAKDLNLPVVIVNIGPTRADSSALVKISTKCGDILPAVCNSLFK